MTTLLSSRSFLYFPKMPSIGVLEMNNLLDQLNYMSLVHSFVIKTYNSYSQR